MRIIINLPNGKTAEQKKETFEYMRDLVSMAMSWARVVVPSGEKFSVRYEFEQEGKKCESKFL